MASVKLLTADIQESQSIKLISAALGEIATMKLKKIRDEVQTNVDYFKQISDIYRAVKIIALKIRHETLHPFKKNGKTISVLLTSNYHLYGGLDTELTRFYIVNTVKFPTDRLVVGKVGAGILTGMRFAHSFDTLFLQTDNPGQAESTELLGKIRSFSRILFYHSQLVTILKQTPAVSDISTEETTLESTVKAAQIDYLLEPEVDRMLNFFETQILGSLINSIFLEAEVARTAARMISMDKAQENADSIIKKQKGDLLRARRSIINQKILETYIGTLGHEHGS